MSLGNLNTKEPNIGLEKQALLGSALSLGARLGGKVVTNPATREAVKTYLKGFPKEIASQALGFGAFSGGLEAAMAEKGHRLEALKRGIGEGALMGAGFGAGSALIRGPAMALRRKMLTRAAPIGVAGKFPAAEKVLNVEKGLERGWFGSLKDIATGKGPVGRRGAAINALAGPAQVAAEWGIPMTAFPASFGGTLYALKDDPIKASPQAFPEVMQQAQGALRQKMMQGHPYPQHARPSQQLSTYSNYNQPYKTAQDNNKSTSILSHTPPEILGGLVGGTGANLLARLPLRYLEKKYKIPTLAMETVPTAASVAGFLTGRQKAQELFPRPETEQLEKLKNIDMDKLMRYYKKRPENIVGE